MEWNKHLLPVYAGHAAGWMLCLAVHGTGVQTICECVVFSALLELSMVDWYTYEIPLQWNLVIFLAGMINLMAEPSQWPQYIAGMFCVSLPLLLLLIVSHGKAIGDGDVKLLAAAGLLLGWEKILLALMIGCISGTILHLWRMRFAGAGRQLAFGPYLSFGIVMAMLWGDRILDWYLHAVWMIG